MCYTTKNMLRNLAPLGNKKFSSYIGVQMIAFHQIREVEALELLPNGWNI